MLAHGLNGKQFPLRMSTRRDITHVCPTSLYSTHVFTGTACSYAGLSTSRPSYAGTSKSHVKARAASSPLQRQKPLNSPQAVRSHRHSFSQAIRCRLCSMRCVAAQQSTEKQHSSVVSPDVGKGKKLLIIGGTGRVGSSTAASLRETHPNLEITLGSQSREKYDAAIEHRPSLKGLAYKVVNRDNLQSLLSAMEDCDMVLHTAGPFQRKKDCLVLEAAIQAKKPYIGKLPCMQSTQVA